jgi:hypothetical protein
MTTLKENLFKWKDAKILFVSTDVLQPMVILAR